MNSPRAACGVTPQVAALADRQSRIDGALESNIAAHAASC